MIPILGEWMLPAREGTCPADHPGIPERWYDDSRQPSPVVAERYPHPIFLRNSEGASQQRSLPPYPDGPILSPSDTLLIYEIAETDLSPGERDLLEFCLYQVMRVRHQPKNMKARQTAIRRLHNDKGLAALVAQKVLGGVPVKSVLEPKQLKRLFGERGVGDRTLQRDVSFIRKQFQASRETNSTKTSNNHAADMESRGHAEMEGVDKYHDDSEQLLSVSPTGVAEPIESEKIVVPDPAGRTIHLVNGPVEDALDHNGHVQSEAGELPETIHEVAQVEKDVLMGSPADISDVPPSAIPPANPPERLKAPTGLIARAQKKSHSGHATTSLIFPELNQVPPKSDTAAGEEQDTAPCGGADDESGIFEAETVGEESPETETSGDVTLSVIYLTDLPGNRNSSIGSMAHTQRKSHSGFATASPDKSKEGQLTPTLGASDGDKPGAVPQGSAPDQEVDRQTEKPESLGGENIVASHSPEESTEPDSRLNHSTAPTEASVIPTLVALKQLVPDLPPPAEVFAIIRRHGDEQNIEDLLEWLAGKKDKVEARDESLVDSASNLLWRLRALTRSSGESSQEKP